MRIHSSRVNILQAFKAPLSRSADLSVKTVSFCMKAIKPPQADINLLDWETDFMTSMQLKVWPRASADWDTKTLVNDQPEKLQQEVKGAAAELTVKRVGDIHLFSKADESSRPAEWQQLLSDHKPTSATSHDEVRCNSHSGDELNNTKSDKNDEKPHSMKWKWLFSSQDGPMHKKLKPHFQQRSIGQHRPHFKPHGRSSKLHSSLDQALRVVAIPSPQAWPSAPHTTDTDMSPNCCNLDRLFRAALLTLIEVTFHLHSSHCCFFTAVIQNGCAEQEVSFSQVVWLIASIGHVGKIADFTIKLIEQHSFLLTGFSRHTSSRPSFNDTALSTAAKTGCIHSNVTCTRSQKDRAVHVNALVLQRSEPLSSDDNSGLSDSDPDLSSDDDRCLSEAKKQGRSSKSKYSSWEPVDEQRLLAYKKEGKSWDWIFDKFKGRTEAAIRTRWTMIQCRVK